MKKPLSWKVILLFFFGIYFFHQSGLILGYLRDYKFAEQTRLSKNSDLLFNTGNFDANRASDLLMASGFLGFLLSVVGLTLAVFICRLRKWHWLNAVIALIPVFILPFLNLKVLHQIKRILRMPGTVFEGWAYYLFNGLILFSIGMFLLWKAKTWKKNNKLETVKMKS